MVTNAPARTILQHIRDLVEVETTKGLTDAQLLQRFAGGGEEPAFAALISRHGGLVWGVCRHILHREQDAEDAFQATFLVLARRPGSIRKTQSIGSWLYGVAYRVAMKAKTKMRKRQARESACVERSADRPAHDLAWRELQAILDEEVQRLPEKYRAPFVFCCLEGGTREAASRELGLSAGTLSSRIARARQTLQGRLLRRGVMLSAAMCAHAIWSQSAAGGVPASLAVGTIQAACGRHVSADVLALVEAVGGGSIFLKWSAGAVLVLVLGLLSAAAAKWQAPPAVPAPAETLTVEDGPPARKDLHGDLLPAGALARLGTVRLRAPGSQLALTADGKEIVAVDADLKVRRFDALTGELRGTRQLPGSALWFFKLSPRGRFVLSQSRTPNGQFQLDLWDLAQEKRVQTLPCGEFSIWSNVGIAFSADEDQVVLTPYQVGTKRKVVLWDLKTFKAVDLWTQERDIYERSQDPLALFSPDGRRVIACHLDLIIRCWDAENGKLLWESERRHWSAFLCFSPDSQSIICDAERLDASTGKLSKDKLRPPKEAIYPFGFSADGKWMAFENGFGEMVLWQPGAAKAAFKLPAPPHCKPEIYHTRNHIPTNFVFTGDSKALIRREGALQRWDLTTGHALYAETEEWGHTEEVSRLLFSPDGKLVASSSKDQSIRLWDVAKARPLHALGKDLSDHLAFAPDGRSLFAIPQSANWGVLRQWDMASGRTVRDFATKEDQKFGCASIDREIRISADGRQAFLLTWANGGVGDQSVLTTFDLQSGKCLSQKTVPWDSDSPITPDGKSVVAVDHGSNSVKLWDLNTATQQFTFETDRQRDEEKWSDFWDLVLSPSGRLMAEHAHFGRGRQRDVHYDDLRIGDVKTGRQLAKLPCPDRAVFAFSADDRLLAVATRGSVRLWETASWKEVGSIKMSGDGGLEQDPGATRSLAFSPNGLTLATGHADSTIVLWDVTLRGGMRGGEIPSAQVEALWQTLAGTDAAQAYAAVWRLVDDPKQTVPLLAQRLKPTVAAAPEVTRRLLADLDSGKYGVRTAAEKALRDLAEKAEPALREALQANPSLEMRLRLEALVKSLDSIGPMTGEALREVRAICILENIVTNEARSLLERLAKGTAPTRQTRAAREAIARLTPP
jgi:RNA polymerase sigma factor (sigma-70 family)